MVAIIGSATIYVADETLAPDEWINLAEQLCNTAAMHAEMDHMGEDMSWKAKIELSPVFPIHGHNVVTAMLTFPECSGCLRKDKLIDGGEAA